MLHEFIALNRDAIIARTRERVGTRAWPSVTTHELEHGVPLFLAQLTETLRLETTSTPFTPGAVGASAAVYGGELFGHRRERLSVVTFLDEIAAVAVLHSEYRGIRFTLEPVDPNLAVEGDQQLLETAVMNLLHNAFKYTHAGGHVALRARAEKQRLVIEIEDECGGIPEGNTDLFEAFGDRRGNDRSGLGLGLSMARKAVRAHDGDISIRNMPGKGCVFVIEMPMAAAKDAPLRESVEST